MGGADINIGFLMDAGLLILLAATVVVAFKLTLSFRAFKNSRADMNDVVTQVIAAIDQAQAAVGEMNATARKRALELDEIINDAKKIVLELRLMNEAGNDLADRLEQLADRNLDFVRNTDERVDRKEVIDDRSAQIVVLHADQQPAAEFQSLAERELFAALQDRMTRQRNGA